MSLTRARTVAVVVGASVVSGLGCGYLADDVPPASPLPLSVAIDGCLPNTGLDDWITYADHVSVVTVVSEQQLDPQPLTGDPEGPDATVGRELILRVDRTLWVAPNAVAPTTYVARDWGWTLKGGQLTESGGMARLEVGRQYLVPVTPFAQGWGSLSLAPIPVHDGAIAVELPGVETWLVEFAGMPLDDLEARLNALEPTSRGGSRSEWCQP